MADVQHKSLNGTDLHAVEREYAGNPHNNVSGIKGQFCKDTVSGKRYVNTDGTVSVLTQNWEEIFDPNHSQADGAGSTLSLPTNKEHHAAAVAVADDDDLFESSDVETALAEMNKIAVHRENFYIKEDRFPCRMPCIRNEEMNNLLSTASGTEILVSVAPSGGSLTLSWLPYIESLLSPESGKEWALVDLDTFSGPAEPDRTGDYADILKVTSGNYATKVLGYTTAKGSAGNFMPGDKVMLYNPFVVGWDFFHPAQVVDNEGSTPSHWRYLQVGCGGVFRHSNGNLIMIVNGWDSSVVSRIGAASSSDLVNFTFLNSDAAIFTPGGSDWRSTKIYASGPVIKLRNEDRYIVYINGYDGSKNKIGWAKFDEDFTQIEYSATECIDSSGSSDGFYGANVIFYGGRFRMAYCDRKTGNPDSSTWEIREAFGETPESFTDSAVICAGAVVNDGLYRSSHSDECCYFTHRGRLYLLVSGTSRYKNSGNRGNRCFGLFYLDDDGTWREDIRNPVFINPFYGTDVWGSDWSWCADHFGGYPHMYFNPTDGKLYIYWSATTGTNNYKVGVARIDIENLI